VFYAKWKSCLPFCAKPFLWCAMVGVLPLVTALKRTYNFSGTCGFYTTIDEDSQHKFISCHIAKGIWIVILQMRGLLIGNVLSPFQYLR
jgi:hypothetical protein